MTTLAPAGTQIVPPADFPVRWADPADAAYHWTRDREHNPQPITPMFSSFAALTAGAGRARTVEVYGEAILARRDLQFNGYNYSRVVPFTGTPAEMEARICFNRERVGTAAFRLSKLWEQEWLPDLKSAWRFWQQFDLSGATLPGLTAHLEQTIQFSTKVYEIHYLMGPPIWWALDEFAKYYCDLFEGQSSLDAHRLLQGFDNQTLRIGRALWRLSRLAAQSDTVCQTICTLPSNEIELGLRATPQGRAFLSELRAFQQGYGQRSDLWDWGYPSWSENPAPIFHNLKQYLAAPGRDPAEMLRGSAEEREQAIAAARARLAGYPRPIVERFEKLLAAAQTALVLSEDHTYWIDFNGFGWVRRVILECGRRLAAAERLGQPEDVFYLSIGELIGMMKGSRLDLREKTARRRLENLRWSTYPAPVELGTRPEQPLSIYSADGLRMARYLGCYVEECDPQPIESGTLRGQPGSSGKVRGRARVILNLADAYRLQPGEILVTTTTAPPWAPLFLIAAGLVTDAGGLLSHGAVVSREYRIPAVVGTGSATRSLRDGQMVEVDGDHGTVTIL